ncbi:ATP synthase delta chain [hydrothermal vent metagenome]|uniref:ATP synthase delta chain n=1 Tax=hydrothermal vent metagenome TaxID=652676 RepID=A0A3B1BYA7_9ZZZZ
MKETAVALRYANALANCFDSATLDIVNNELKEIAALIEDNQELRAVLLNPAIPLDVKQKTIREIVKQANYKSETGDALRTILENGRIDITGVIAGEFEKLVFKSLGKVRVKVTSAAELSDEESGSLQGKLKSITGLDPVVDINVDPSIIGGVVAQIGSLVYDGSIKSQLEALRIKT